MATNCYEFSLPVEICVDGPVGNGQTTTMRAWILAPSDLPEGGTPKLLGTVNNWDGSTVVFTGWAKNDFGGCDVVSDSITVSLIGADLVQVTVDVLVDTCSSGWGIYEACGGFGPHNFTDTRTVTMTGADCSQA